MPDGKGTARIDNLSKIVQAHAREKHDRCMDWRNTVVSGVTDLVTVLERWLLVGPDGMPLDITPEIDRAYLRRLQDRPKGTYKDVKGYPAGPPVHKGKEAGPSHKGPPAGHYPSWRNVVAGNENKGGPGGPGGKGKSREFDIMPDRVLDPLEPDFRNEAARRRREEEEELAEKRRREELADRRRRQEEEELADRRRREEELADKRRREEELEDRRRREEESADRRRREEELADKRRREEEEESADNKKRDDEVSDMLKREQEALKREEERYTRLREEFEELAQTEEGGDEETGRRLGVGVAGGPCVGAWQRVC